MALVERETALEILENSAEYYSRIDDCTEHTIRLCISAIKKIAVEDAAPVVHGNWIKCGGYTECSECEYWYDSPESEDAGDRSNYCPNCGARMDGGEGHEAG